MNQQEQQDELIFNEMKERAFQSRPGLKALFQTFEENPEMKKMSLKEYWDHVSAYQVDTEAFPYANGFIDAICQFVQKIQTRRLMVEIEKKYQSYYTPDFYEKNKMLFEQKAKAEAGVLAKKYAKRLNENLHQSSKLDMQTHAGFPCGHDGPKKYTYSDGSPVADQNYNTFLCNSTILEMACSDFVLQGLYPYVSGNNETSPRLQYTSDIKDIYPIMRGKIKSSSVGFFEPNPEQIRYFYQKDKSKFPKKEGFLDYELPENFPKELHIIFDYMKRFGFQDTLSLGYEKIINEIFEKKQRLQTVDSGKVPNYYIADLMTQEDSLIHYVHNNPKVYEYFLKTFAGIQMSWTVQKDEQGNEWIDGGYKTKPIKGNLPGKNTDPTITFGKQGDDIVIETPENLQKGIYEKQFVLKALEVVIWTIAEFGMFPFGGMAQISYNAQTLERLPEFLQTICDNAGKTEGFPPLPQKLKDTLPKRIEVIENLKQYNTSPAAFNVLQRHGDGRYMTYADYLSDSDLKITEGHLKSVRDKNAYEALLEMIPVINAHDWRDGKRHTATGEIIYTCPPEDKAAAERYLKSRQNGIAVAVACQEKSGHGAVKSLS